MSPELLSIVASVVTALLLSTIVWAWRRSVRNAEVSRKRQWLELVSQARSGDHGLAPACLAACAEAGLRLAECEMASQPLIKDPVAKVLCGKAGYRHGQLYTRLMMEQEGAGKSSQLAARARVLDDDLSFTLATVVKEDPDSGTVQVVSLGCGMDTRPWRLRRGGSSRSAGGPQLVWYEVDLPQVVELKSKLLQDAGVDLGRGAEQQRQQQQLAGRQPPGKRQREQLPILAVDQLHSVACDLSQGGALEPALELAGFRPTLPTIWVLEGLLYRLPLARATALLRECSRMCGPGSHVMATLVSRACVQACQAMSKQEEHPQLSFLHCLEDLLAPGALEGTGWGSASVTGDLADLSRTRYKVECYPYFGRFAYHELERLSDVEHVLTLARS